MYFDISQQHSSNIVKKATSIYNKALQRVEEELDNVSFEDAIKILKTFNPLLKNIHAEDYQSQKRQLDKEIQKKEPIKVKILFD